MLCRGGSTGTKEPPPVAGIGSLPAEVVLSVGIGPVVDVGVGLGVGVGVRVGVGGGVGVGVGGGVGGGVGVGVGVGVVVGAAPVEGQGLSGESQLGKLGSDPRPFHSGSQHSR